MRARRLIVLILSAAMGCVAGHAQSGAEKVLLEKARSLEARGRLDLAAQNWQQVLLSEPNNTEALAGAARAYASAGQPERAREYLDRLRAINPSDPQIGQIGAMHPQQAVTQQLRHAGQLAESGKYAEAMAIYRQAYGNNPPPGDMALAYYETEAAIPESRAAAIAGLRECVRKYPGDPRYETTLGKILTYDPKTRSDGMTMLKKYPSDPGANEALRQALKWEAANPAASGAIRGYLKGHPDAELQGELDETEAKQSKQNNGLARTPEERAAFAALAANKLDDAERRFTELRDRQPQNPRVLAGLGFLSMKRNDFAAAVNYLESADANGAKSGAVTSALSTSKFWLVMTDGGNALKDDQADVALEQYRKAVQMRPTNPDALRGLAGTLLRAQQPAEAAQVYLRLTHIQPASTEGWRGVVLAECAAGNSRGALETASRLPSGVHATLARDPQYLSALAGAYQDVGDEAGRQRTLAEGMELPFPQDGRGLTAAEQMAFAELLVQAKRYSQAAGIYRLVILQDPANLAAYEALIRTQHASGQDGLALATVEDMPPDVLSRAEGDAGFLGSIAAVYQSQGKLDIAQMFMEKSLALSADKGQAVPTSMELALAGIYMARGNVARAYPLYQRILAADPKRMDAWIGLFNALHAAKRDREALTELQQIPAAAMVQLDKDPRFLRVLASIYSDSGDATTALRTMRQAATRYEQKNSAPPADFSVQYCYLLLHAGDEQNLYTQLMHLGLRQNLTAEETGDVQTVWAAWSVRRAAVAARAGNNHKALQILDAADRAFPNNPNVQKALAGGYQQAGEAKRAESIYLQMDWANAKVDDYRGALGAALQARDLKQAALWLDAALTQFPEDPQILQQAAHYEQARGNTRKAAEFFQQSLQAMGPADPSVAILADLKQPLTNASSATPQANPGQQLMRMLAQGMQPGANADGLAATAQPTADYLPGQAPVPMQPDRAETNEAPTQITAPSPSKKSRRTEPEAKPVSPENLERLGDYNPPEGRLTPGDLCTLNRAAGLACSEAENDPAAWTVKQAAWPVAKQPLAAIDAPAAGVLRTASAPEISASSSVSQQTGSQPAQPTLRDEVQDQLNALQGGYSPWIGGTAMVSTRSGQPGFDHFVVFSEPLEASAVLNDAVRASIIVKPVLLDAGVANGQSSLLQGTNQAGCGSQPGCTIYTQTASGTGGEIQLRSNNFGVSAGYSPYGFLVSNVIGSLYANPSAGPLTFTLNRDSVVDTQLSYSGLVNTGTAYHDAVWGGVVANAFQAQYAKASDHSGFYIQGGGQYITGNHVQTNARADGDAGAYWHAASWPDYGTVTFGMNMFAMHYEHNLRYFTYGQGGYFSPDAYLLANIPVRFDGHSGRNFHYRIDGSLGVQAFQEDAAPYYPLDPTLEQSSSPPLMYPTRNSISGNYLIDAEGAYRVSEHWFAGGFLNANNSRDYNSVNIGFYVRYMFRSQFPTEEGPPTGIFPATGLRPMQVP